MEKIIIPLVVAIIAAIVTAFLTIQITYAETKKEAVDGIKSTLYKIILSVSLISQCYNIYIFIISSKPLDRIDIFILIFNMIVITSSILAIIFAKLIISISKNQNDLASSYLKLQEKHINLTGKILDNTISTNKN